jgi:membrane protease YdiL (CAAX protease family)
VLLVLAFLVPYTIGWSWGWWKFALSALLILLLWWWAKPVTFRGDLGLRLGMADLLMGSLVIVVVGLTARLIVPGILRPHGYTASLQCDGVWKYLAVPFQTLNEEMVLRAFLLSGLAHFMRVRLPASIAVAVVFTGLHFFLYRFGPPHIVLSIQALVTLLLVGVACNEFFLATGSIAIPYGIHLGWNLTRFGNDWIHQYDGNALEPGADFNLIEGDPWVLAVAVGLALIASIVRFRHWIYSAQSNFRLIS